MPRFLAFAKTTEDRFTSLIIKQVLLMSMYPLNQITRASLYTGCLILIGCLCLSGCIPTVQTIYHAPAVTGQVIDLETLKPVEGAIVQHGIERQFDFSNLAEIKHKDAVKTDKAGNYQLPALSSVEFTLLMAGHAFKYYPLSISTRYNSALVYARAPMKMLSHNETMAPTVLLDPSPEIAAKTAEGDFIEDKTLRAYLYPHSTLGTCNATLGLKAINLLNTARKIYWRHKVDSKYSQQLLDDTYSGLWTLWEEFYRSCDLTSLDLTHKRIIYQVFDSVQQEVSLLSQPPEAFQKKVL